MNKSPRLEILSASKLKIELNRQSQEWTLTFSGAMGIDDLAAVDKYFAGLWRQDTAKPGSLVFDLSGLNYLDSDAAFLLYKQEKIAADKKISLAIKGLKPELERIRHLVNASPGLQKKALLPAERKTGFIESLGMSAYTLMQDAYQVIAFFGNIISLSFKFIVKPHSMRWDDMLFQMQQVGWGGLPIVGLIAMLLGMILAFMSILQLKPFGADIYVSSLVSVAMVKELGPIMTSILLAGRSGSAFAAEIGSMKENEEVDALQVMGYNPIMFLAMPRVVATVLIMPILNMFANFFGIMGGLLVGVVAMNLNFNSYIDHTVRSLDVGDLVVSTVKVVCFAFLIAGVGCQRGFMVRGGSSAVGKATTSSVVTSIFLIIVVDSLFAIVEQFSIW